MIINNYFHDNNSATTASLVKEKTLRAVVDCVFLHSGSLLSTVQYFAGYTREAYYLRCSTLLVTFRKFIVYVAIFY